MSWTIDPVTIRVFIAVCEERTIAKAAERELIAASAISKRIADLEGLIGTALLHRGQRGVQPTTMGQTLYTQGQVILRSLDALKAELGESEGNVRGHVRVWANPSAIMEFLPEELSRFLATHPYIRLDLEERFSAKIVRGVLDGSAEIGICRYLTSMSDLHATRLASDHFVVVMSESHPLAENRQLAFADTLDHEQLSLSKHTALAPILQSAAAHAGRELRLRIQVSSFEAAFRMIHSGLVISVLPREAIGRYADIYRLRAIPLTDAWAARNIMLCVRDPQNLSPAARRLYDHLSQNVRGG